MKPNGCQGNQTWLLQEFWVGDCEAHQYTRYPVNGVDIRTLSLLLHKLPTWPCSAKARAVADLTTKSKQELHEVLQEGQLAYLHITCCHVQDLIH